MPAAIKNIALPEWADPKMESVTSPLYKTLIRKAVSLAGLDNPIDSVMQAAAPTISSLVSIFKNKAAREVSTNIFKDMAGELPPRITHALDEFARKYPRVAAHLRPRTALPGWPFDEGVAARIDTGYGKIHSPMAVDFTKLGQTRSNVYPFKEGLKNSLDTTFHEGTHGAQALGNSNFNELYDLSDELLGYGKNPFEVTSRTAGGAANALDPPRIRGKKINAMNELREIVDGFGGVDSSGTFGPYKWFVDRFGPKKASAAVKIDTILRERASRGWKPSK